MKILKTLVISLLIIIMSAPKIFKLYVEIYNNYIANEKELTNKVKKMVEADEHIKTTIITNNYEEIEKQKKDVKKQNIFQQLRKGL